MKKIGILGGTFDPIHNQHLNIAKTAYQKLDLDEVWILPTKQNPLKTGVNATDEQRIAMIKLVIKDYLWLKLNDYELKSQEPSYTINTITHFVKHYPDYQFSFIIGSDNLYTLHKWQAINKLVTLVKMVVVNRPHYRKTLQLMAKYQCHNLFVHPSSDISSAKIRKGKVITQIDEKVNNYINDNLLYSINRLQYNLEIERVQHCQNVGLIAQQLAEHYQINSQEALIAGTYHDLCKQWSKDKMSNYLVKYSYEHILQEPWAVWHGYVSALYLKNHYRYHNELVLNAIAKHTTGDIEMNKLDLIVLLADKISQDRKQAYVQELRTLAFKDLTLAFKSYLQLLKRHLLITKQPLNRQFHLIFEQWNCKGEKKYNEQKNKKK